MQRSKNTNSNRLKIGCLFLHTLDGSLGSFTRIKELSASCSMHGVDTYIMTPYEHERTLSEHIRVCPIPTFALRLGFAPHIYTLSRKFYYNKLLFRLLNGSRSNLLLDAFSNKLAKVLRANNIQILQAEQDFSLSACKRVKTLTEIPLIADIHNISSEEFIAAGIIERDSKEFRALQYNTAENLSMADVVVVVSDLMKKYVESEYGISSTKVVVVPPGGRVRVDCVTKNPKHNFVYAGLVSYRENVELFVRSMPQIKKAVNDAQFFITRKGDMIGKLMKLASTLNVNPDFFWYDNVQDLYEFLSSCYAGIVPSSDDVARRMGTPVKLFDYLSFGLPVIANNIGGWTELIAKHKIGVLTENDPSQFAEGLVNFLSSNREEYAQNALELISEKYNWDNSALSLVDSYNRLLN